MRKVSDKQKTDNYSDEEINELAEWLENLTLKETFFLKESFESFLAMKSANETDLHVH